MSLLGLKELIRRSKPDECPFCGDPRAQGTTKPHLTCGDEICKSAYQTYYGRDRRRVPLSRAQMDRNNKRKRALYAAQKERRT